MKRISYIIVFFFGLSSVFAQDTPLKLSLQEAIDYAIKNSFNNKVAKNDISAAEKKRWETIATGLPQINAQVDYRNNLKQPVSLLPGEIAGGAPGTFVPVVFGTKQTMNASATLTQLLFNGSYLVGLQASKTYLKISQQAKEKTELATREAVINAYGNVIVAEERIEILKGNKKTVDSQLKGAQEGFKVGLIEEETVEQFEITQGNIISQQRNADKNKEIAYQMLNLSLGNDVNKPLELTDTIETLVSKNTNLELLSKEFNLNNHIDFKIAENNVESSRLQMQLEKSKALPSLTAFVNYGFAANADSFNFFNSNQQWFQSSILGVGLNIPIFSSLGREAKTTQAKIALETADIRLQETKQRLSLQAQQAKSNYELSIENYETSKRSLELATRIERKQKIKFDEGVTTSIDLLAARNQLYGQQNNYLQAILNIITNKAKLENALNVPLK